MTPEFTENPLYFSWPFWVLELTPSCKNAQIEKAAREIAARIQLDVPGADEYTSPRGPLKRDDFLVREAKHKLQDPKTRLLAEYWYVNSDAFNDNSDEDDSHSVADWMRSLGVQLWEA